mmetsp:Transcript_27580/g.38368  ORF Transcript_27580/g.38368 Transcript_27580/m.38368 type:complete len:119 (-) Transcript_27580:14-370(-)
MKLIIIGFFVIINLVVGTIPPSPSPSPSPPPTPPPSKDVIPPTPTPIAEEDGAEWEPFQIAIVFVVGLLAMGLVFGAICFLYCVKGDLGIGCCTCLGCQCWKGKCNDRCDCNGWYLNI